MIGIFIVTLLVFALAVTGMSIGILAGRQGPVTGCATAHSRREDTQECEVCGRSTDADGCVQSSGTGKRLE